MVRINHPYTSNRVENSAPSPIERANLDYYRGRHEPDEKCLTVFQTRLAIQPIPDDEMTLFVQESEP